MEDCVWLLEYVSQTKGAHQLKLISTSMNFFQYHSLDVMLVLVVVVTAVCKLLARLRVPHSNKLKKIERR
jgi:hypothetical protein